MTQRPASGQPVVAGLSSNEFVLPSDPVARGAMRSVTTDRFHYILNGDAVEELYDLEGSGEEQDLAGSSEYEEDLARLRSLDASGEKRETRDPSDSR